MKGRILAVITGGIAAYKAVEVVRALVKQGMEVRVVMTSAATAFVTPLTFQTLSGNPVGVDMFGDSRTQDALAHISFAQWPGMVLVCPATANFIAKLAHGIADDLCSSTLLATHAPLLICPAMNDGMWDHPATRDNIEILRRRSVSFLGPESGSLACQAMGKGRMSEPDFIVAEVTRRFRNENRPRVIVTAGGTREALDRVRVLTNLSTGRLGAEIADACTEKGFEVIWLHGANAEKPRLHCAEVGADSVDEVEIALRKHLSDPGVVAVIHCMAVSDFVVSGVISLKEAFSVFSKAKSAKDAEKQCIKLAARRNKTGKIPSSEAIAPILLPGKKLIDSIRAWAANQRLFLVSFKLTSGVSEHELIAIARKQAELTKSDLVVANDSEQLSPEGHRAWLVSASAVEGPHTGKFHIAREIAKKLWTIHESSMHSPDPPSRASRQPAGPAATIGN